MVTMSDEAHALRTGECRPSVESRDGAVDVGTGSRSSPAAFAMVLVPQSVPYLRFHPPLIEPDVRSYRIRLSDGLHEETRIGRDRAGPRSHPAWSSSMIQSTEYRVVPRDATL
jgi:hypothetical protein